MITKIIYNWRQYNDGESAGEDFDEHEIGKNGVKEISLGEYEDLKTFFIVEFEDGSRIDIYNPNQVFHDNADRS